MLIRGRLERSEGVINIVAEHLAPLPLAATTSSRDFHYECRSGPDGVVPRAPRTRPQRHLVPDALDALACRPRSRRRSSAPPLVPTANTHTCACDERWTRSSAGSAGRAAPAAWRAPSVAADIAATADGVEDSSSGQARGDHEPVGAGDQRADHAGDAVDDVVDQLAASRPRSPAGTLGVAQTAAS